MPWRRCALERSEECMVEGSSSQESADIVVEQVISMETVATHNSKESCYTTVNSFVYDLTPFITQHPGGEDNIMKICGRDGTSMFTRKHGENDKALQKLSSLQIGILAIQ